MEPLFAQVSERRRLLGLTREEAYKKFRVPLAFIVAIEEGQFDRLPAAVYARGFLRSYCEGLALEPGPLLDVLDHTMHRRARFRVGFFGGGTEARPAWLQDALTWAAR